MTLRQKAIADRLARILKRNGGILTPNAVLDDARDASSPLHDQFEWDDTEAAHQYRLQQARALIRSVKIDVKTESHTISTVRYVRDPTRDYDEQGYMDVVKLRTRADLARETLHREFGCAMALLRRAEFLAEAFDMKNEIVDLRNRVAELDKRLKVSHSKKRNEAA